MPGHETPNWKSWCAQNPGFVDVKSYTAADGDRLTVVGGVRSRSGRVEKPDAPSRSPNTGYQKWYEYCNVDVATITRSRSS